ITEETKFIDDLGADSLDIFEIITAIEDSFDITIDDSQAETIITVGDAADAIRNAVK
ncbi:MAG: acyl carrier protein, partial [Lachnospiraceae bacterium]|nr:acyl carrier protein [Lachnospiraceae bacterium]